jgi:hypothetical protein
LLLDELPLLLEDIAIARRAYEARCALWATETAKKNQKDRKPARQENFS